MVLDKARGAGLERRVREEMPAHRVGTGMQESIVEALVVRVVEPQLLQPPLEIPVDLCDEQKSRHRVARIGPEFAPAGRRRQTPGFFEHVGQHQHRHVAARAVSMLRDKPQLVDHGVPCVVARVVELRDVGPRRKVRIARAGDRLHVSRRQINEPERRRITPERLFAASHEPLGIRRRPGMIEADVVRDEIEQQPHAAGVQGGARAIDLCQRADPRIGFIAADAVRGSDDVLQPPAGKRQVIDGKPARLGTSDPAADRAALPDAHEIDDVDAACPKGIPFRVRH